jgi:hypothetical protein
VGYFTPREVGQMRRFQLTITMTVITLLVWVACAGAIPTAAGW